MLENLAKDSTFIKPIITGDEMWAYEHDGENVQQTQLIETGKPKIRHALN